MLSRLLLTLVSLLLALCAPAQAGGLARSIDDGVDELIARFRTASFERDLDVRREALEALVSSGDLDVAAEFFAAFGRTSEAVRAETERRTRLTFALDRARIRLAVLENADQTRGDLAEALTVERQRLAGIDADLDKTNDKLEREGPWYAALLEGAARFAASLSAPDLKKLVKELERDAEKAVDPFTRRTSIELLGELGPAGTALDLHGMLADWRAEQVRHYKKLPKLMDEVRKIEGRMQTLGASSDLVQQYEKAKREANTERAAARELAGLVDLAIVAGGRALAREQGEPLGKSIAKLLKEVQKGRGGVKLDTLELLSYADNDGVRAALRASLEQCDDGLVLGAAIDALVQLGDRELVPRLVDSLITHEHEYVRARSVAALAALRAPQALPVLIDRLELEQGRARSDIGQALTSLTGKDYHGNVALWRRWWEDNAQGFEVVAVDEASEDAGGQAVGVTFFGIETESQRVLFVLDVSGSMAFTTASRPGVDESDPNSWPYLQPVGNEIDRMTAARRALVKALGGLRDGAIFNFVVYASSVWTWQDDLVEMEEQTRGEALAFVEGLVPEGGTNIHGALVMAFELAGVESSMGGEWSEPAIDTIYLLTDGKASVGVTTDPEEILFDVRQLNRTAGIVIHTIGLSDGHDADLLRRLAEDNGGSYVGR